MTCQLYLERLSPWLFFLGYVPVGVIALAVPTLPPVFNHHGISASIAQRTEKPVATVYGGFFDVDNDSSKDSYMPVAQIFKALAEKSIVASSIRGDPTTTAVQTYITAPPSFHGPGLAILSTPVIYSTSTSSPSSVVIDSQNVPVANHTNTQTHTAILLGAFIGGILLFTLCLFLLLSPSISGRIGSICRNRKPLVLVKGPSGSGDQEKGSTQPPMRALVLVSGTNGMGKDRIFVGQEHEQVVEMSKYVKDDDTLTDVARNVPASKFSICSSDYNASSRKSQMSLNPTQAPANNPKQLYQAGASVTFAPGTTPSRPPRPPTADSPALSESVYLACADKNKNYIVMPSEPLSKEERSDEPRKRMLTPSEFFALHVPGILAGFSLSSVSRLPSSSSSKKSDRASTTTTGRRRSPNNSKRDSYHSRTKSAPLLGPGFHSKKRETKGTFSVNDDGQDDFVAERDADLADGSMVERITKHRRSRSASGWAYPDRPKSRRNHNRI